MWCGSPPTRNRLMTRYVRGSITSTVPSRVLGTYTRGGMPATAGLRFPGRSAAYRLPGRGPPGIRPIVPNQAENPINGWWRGSDPLEVAGQLPVRDRVVVEDDLLLAGRI